ncbi:hypothetical protein IWW45_008220 [Coemansia sp. RSA 485]|nr:hypothetical protein IWW45_008220 [Coemansia sp. RSA 485]
MKISPDNSIADIEDELRLQRSELRSGEMYFSVHPPSHATIKPLAETTKISTICFKGSNPELHMMMELVANEYLGYDGKVHMTKIPNCMFSTTVGELLDKKEMEKFGRDLDLYITIVYPSRVGFAYALDDCTLDDLAIKKFGYKLYAVARVD